MALRFRDQPKSHYFFFLIAAFYSLYPFIITIAGLEVKKLVPFAVLAIRDGFQENGHRRRGVNAASKAVLR